MNGYNFSDASDIRLGSSTITALYYGSTLIWPLGPAPTNWANEYLQTTLLSGGRMTFYIDSGVSTDVCTSISYSFDKINWTTTQNVNNTTVEISPPYKPADTVIYWKGDATQLGGITYQCRLHTHINYSGTYFNVAGNVMSLLYGDNFIGQTTLPSNYTFAHLFEPLTSSGDVSCVSAENLVLPATTLTEGCYYDMFLSNSKLTTAPILPATTLTDYCYQCMFSWCSSLNYIKCLATDMTATMCTSDWVKGVNGSGTFVKNTNTTWGTGDSGIPSGWTIQNI